jgi:hypothetical protein
MLFCLTVGLGDHQVAVCLCVATNKFEKLKICFENI